MESSVKPLEGNKVEVTITVPAEEVTAAIADAYSRISSRLKIPGFRPGKAPRKIVDTHVGRDAVLNDAREELSESTYPLVVNEKDLRPVAPADFGEMTELVEGEPFTFTLTVELKPELTLASDDPIVVTVPSSKSSEAEIDAQIEYVRERFATLEPVDRGIEPGDFALLSFVGLVDGEEYPGNAVDKYNYETGRGMMPEEFDAAIMGVAPGGTARAEFEIPESSAVPEFVGRTATFDIEVHEVKAKVLPAVDDEFAGSVGGFETVAEMREDVRRRLDEAKQAGHAREIEGSARAVVAERLVGEIPQSMVEYRGNAMTEEFFDTLQQRQISIDDYQRATGVTMEQINNDILMRARVVLAEELALEALVRQQGIEITDEMVEQEIREMAGSEPGAVEQYRDRLTQAGMIPLVREQIAHRLAVRWLMDNAEVIEGEAGAEPPAPAKKPRSGKKKEEAAESATETDQS